MRRVRPYIPLSVRVEVAERQAAKGSVIWDEYLETEWPSNAKRLAFLIDHLERILGDVLELDHDPALVLRQYKADRRKPPAAWYTPNANYPEHLVYRPLRDHDHKSFGRKPGAEKTVTTRGSDIWLKSKFKRLEQPTKKRRAKIPARGRPWPKGRKLQGRPFPR